jgi:hypothetical protein
VQTATLESTKTTVPRDKRGFGEPDLWELWLLDEAEEVPCIYYLCSKGTKHCEIHKVNPFAPYSVSITLRGPLADDERNLLLRYRLTPANVGRIKGAEKNLLVSRLIIHYPTQGDEPHQKIRRALTAVGISLSRSMTS